LDAERLKVLDEERDDLGFDDGAVWAAAVAVIMGCTERVRAPSGAASDRSAAIAAEVGEAPTLEEVLAELQ
jgi:hypothetical protein